MHHFELTDDTGTNSITLDDVRILIDPPWHLILRAYQDMTITPATSYPEGDFDAVKAYHPKYVIFDNSVVFSFFCTHKNMHFVCLYQHPNATLLHDIEKMATKFQSKHKIFHAAASMGKLNSNSARFATPTICHYVFKHHDNPKYPLSNNQKIAIEYTIRSTTYIFYPDLNIHWDVHTKLATSLGSAINS